MGELREGNGQAIWMYRLVKCINEQINHLHHLKQSRL